jgi:translation initiation factor IF-1
MKEDHIKVTGTVTSALGRGNFKVQLESGIELLCTLSGKIRQKYIKIIPGDDVEVEVSPYDTTKGRISYRKRTKEITVKSKSYKDSKYGANRKGI